jgi:RHS repeat-associated protein
LAALGPVHTIVAKVPHLVLGLRAFGLEETAAKVGGQTLLNDPAWRQSLLGSTSSVTCGPDVSGCAQGNLFVQESFDAYGVRRGSNWQGAPSASELTKFAQTTRHGYTGHEMLDNIGLIHMNGRVYDPVVGRFLSVDRVLGSGSQGLNRYSYLVNNPVSLTDPSGFEPKVPKRFAGMTKQERTGKYWETDRRSVIAMDTTIADEFLDACNQAFGFLVTDHWFRPAILEIDAKIRFAVVSYLGKNVAVECVFDENERWVEVRIARVVNGARPVDYSTDNYGRRVRISLYPWLIERGVRGFGPREEALSNMPLSEMFRIRLSKDAHLLRKHGADIIADSPKVFE